MVLLIVLILEDIYPMIRNGFSNKAKCDDFERIKTLDFLYNQTIADDIIEFDKKYEEVHSTKQPNKNE